MEKSRKLTLIGTGMFLISFLLPSYMGGNGFNCAWMCASIILNDFSLGSAYYFAFSFSNLLMLTLPFLILVHYRERPTPRFLIGLQILSLLHVLSWLLLNLGDLGSIKIGYYFWLGSMALLLRATWMRCETQSEARARLLCS